MPALTLPTGQNPHGDHASLMKQALALRDLLDSLETATAFTEADMHRLLEVWEAFHTSLLEHLAEEERTYPPVIERHGWSEFVKVEAKIQAAAQWGDPRALGMILQAAGVDIAGSGVAEGWTTGRMELPENRKRLAGFYDAPWSLQHCCCLFPRFIAHFEHAKASLVSVATATDEQHDLPVKPCCGPCLGCVVS